MRKILAVFVIVICVLGSAVAFKAFDFFYSRSGDASEMVVFEVSPGMSFGHVGGQLVKEGLISDLFTLKVVGRLLGYAGNMRVGEYQLNRGMSPGEIMGILSSGKSIERPITFKEGLSMYEVAQMVDDRGIANKQEFLKLCRDRRLIKELLGEDLPSLEGYLFPETYRLTKYTTGKELIRLMVRNFLQVYKSIGPGAALDLSRHKAVILASIIEKETGAPEERPLISSVFHNRLRIGMRIQSDPTILYGILNRTGVMPKNISRKDIREKTEYNTYAIKALPVGPIANPGKEALAATLSPDSSKYLYFVSRNDGTHVFSTNLKDHNRAVRKFQLDRKMRQGKSWRDLSKKKRATN